MPQNRNTIGTSPEIGCTSDGSPGSWVVDGCRSSQLARPGATVGIAFTACDMPHADQFTVWTMALVAQKEREAISQRTKEALAAAKARGVKLGNPRGASHLRRLGNVAAVAALKSAAQERAEGLRATIDDIRSQGITAANAIAQALDEREIAAVRGARWSARTVLDVMQRCLAEGP